MMATQTQSDVDWRIERYVEMEFEHNEAVALANSTSVSVTNGGVKWNTPLNWARVKKAIDAGCTHAQALDIFVNAEI